MVQHFWLFNSYQKGTALSIVQISREIGRDGLGAAWSNPSVQYGQLTWTMWEKLRIQERERTLGMLFMSVLPAVFGYALLAQGSPGAARVVGIALLGFLWVWAVRRLVRLRPSRSGPAPVGPLSPDEKSKARSKLLPGRR